LPRNRTDTKWVTLSDVDVVVAAAINPEQPNVGLVHIFEAKELLERFERAYAARRKEGHSMPVGRGVWVSLYHEESTDSVNRVGAVCHPRQLSSSGIVAIGLRRKPTHYLTRIA
jgi:hypothetical protein